MRKLKIDDGRHWTFLHGQWQDGPEGELIPPDGTEVEYLAVRHDEEYGDFSAQFRFKFRSVIGVARFLFRVQDSGRYYALDVPWVGQQSRGRHFWAGIVKADGTPLQQYLNFGLVLGLGANVDYWYDAKVTAEGPRLRAWINGRLVADVDDSTYVSGRLGLGGIATPIPQTCHFADLQVEGAPVAGSPWRGLEAPAQYWITPCAETDPESCQSYAGLLQDKDGELLLHLTYGNPNHGETRRSVWMRSGDAGRTWSAPAPAALQQGLGANFVRRDGTWVCLFGNEPMTKEVLYSYESADKGQTWKGPTPVEFEGEWPEAWEMGGPVQPVRLHDGALLLPVLCKYMAGEDPSAYLFSYACLVLRSEDDGHSWSAPVYCDRHNLKPGEPMSSNDMALAARYYELGMAEADDDVILGIGRPERDPYMWLIQSNDGGRSWDPGAIGPFPGYCPSLTRTQNGALVATTRFPHFAAHLSRDGGRSWDPPVIIDYARWANQSAVEAEPNVVVVSYMGHCMVPGQADSRIARLRVTSAGLRLDH